jgi:hypothetical protein
MTPARSYQVSGPEIAHQTIDGEVVIVNLRSGAYYSLEGGAAEVWGLLERGATDADMILELQRRFDAPAGILEAEVRRMLAELEQEGIIKASENGGSAPVVSEQVAARRPFAPLVLHKFTDMRDLILLDPIHEVDEGGWPHPREAA